MPSEEQGQELLAASTVVVMRDAAAGPEIFMVRRHEQTAFMGGAFVFPGGRVDPADGWADGLEHPGRQRADLAAASGRRSSPRPR